MKFGISKENLVRLVDRLQERYEQIGLPVEQVWNVGLTYPGTFLVRVTETKSQKKLVISIHSSWRTLSDFSATKDDKHRSRQIMSILADTPLRFDQDLEEYIKRHLVTQWIEYYEFTPDRTQ